MISRIHNVSRTFLRMISSEITKAESQVEKLKIVKNVEILDTNSIEKAIDELSEANSKSVLEKCDEDVSYIAPYLKPTFNLAAYVNQSETLKELLKLGVDLYEIERQKDVAKYIAQLDFERDVKEHVMFLFGLGLPVEEIGKFITKFPRIFKEPLENLQVRIRYLKHKNFNDEMVVRIIERNPIWLKYSTMEIDKKLGFFQQNFKLKGCEVRALTVRKPKLITYDLRKIKINHFVLKEEMGFNPEEVKSILLNQPGIFMKRQENMLKTFEYLHKTMGISLENIARNPQILTCRFHKLKERYSFLLKLNRVQFDPKLPNFISLMSLVSGSDAQFAVEIAKSSVQTYNEFLKTL